MRSVQVGLIEWARHALCATNEQRLARDVYGAYAVALGSEAAGVGLANVRLQFLIADNWAALIAFAVCVRRTVGAVEWAGPLVD